MLRQRLILSLSSVSIVGWRGTSLIGPARVLDGDTIAIADERVRLHGIDAPELDQTFWCDGKELNCGAMAQAALEALIAGITLRCEAIERDRYGRLVAKCFSPKGVDICRRMVASGWALAYRHYSEDYIDAEDAAREAFRGLWRGSFTKPWEWRSSTERGAARAGEKPATTS
jgi:endonuclease YncB( thermonuclease family)